MTLPAAVVEEYRRQHQALLAAHPELADDPDTLADTLEGITSANDVVRSLLRGAEVDWEFVVALKKLITVYSNRAHDLERRHRRRREAAQSIMEAAGITKVTAPEFTASLRALPPRVDIYDHQAIPVQFYDTTPVLNKDRVRAAVEAGQEVPGARKTNGGVSLAVRVA